MENPMDFYKKTLENIIFSDINNDEINRYICAFSLFLSSRNSDYRYNVTYLRRESEEFQNFIKLSKEKIKVIVYIKDVIKEIFIKNNLDTKDVFLLVDEFWTIGLNDFDPYIYDEYSFDSVKTHIMYSLVTLYSKNNNDCRLTFNLRDYENSNFIENMTKIINKVWRIA